MWSSFFKFHYFQETQKQRPVHHVNYTHQIVACSLAPSALLTQVCACIDCTEIVRLHPYRAASTPVPHVTQPPQVKNHLSCTLLQDGRANPPTWILLSHFCPKTCHWPWACLSSLFSAVAISRSLKDSKSKPSTCDASLKALPTSKCFQFRELQLDVVCQSGNPNGFLFWIFTQSPLKHM